MITSSIIENQPHYRKSGGEIEKNISKSLDKYNSEYFEDIIKKAQETQKDKEKFFQTLSEISKKLYSVDWFCPLPLSRNRFKIESDRRPVEFRSISSGV